MTSSASRPAQIVLVRHGRSAHVEPRWLDAGGVRRWLAAYDEAAIAPAPPPPPDLVALAGAADHLVSSDLPRAVASAARLAGARAVETVPLFREAPIETPDQPLPTLGGLRLPLRAWALVFGVRWLRAARRGHPPPGVDATTLARAEDAAAWLVERAAGGGTVLVVTHATFRTLVADALARRGWQPPPRRPLRVWSAWRLQGAD